MLILYYLAVNLIVLLVNVSAVDVPSLSRVALMADPEGMFIARRQHSYL